MFREMRRKRQLLSDAEVRAILEAGTSGVLAVAGDDGYPYAVPMSYGYDHDTGKLYFHCARSGHKLDALRRCPKASFCVVGQDLVSPSEYTSRFRSVIAFGTVREMTDDGEKRAAIERLARRYAPDDTAENRASFIEKEWALLCMLEMTVEHATGKEAIELIRSRESASN